MRLKNSAIACSFIGSFLICGCGLLGKNDSSAERETTETSKTTPAGDLGGALEGVKKFGGIPGLGGLAEAVSGLEKITEDQGKTYGPVIHWKELASVLPEKLSGFEPVGELDAKTTKMGGLEVSTAKRRYKGSDKESAHIEILDTTFAPALRAPFAVAHLLNEDSTRGFKKGTKIGDHQAIVEWNSKQKRSHATLLVGGRFILNVTVDGKDDDNGAEAMAKGLDLAKLNGMVGTLQPTKTE